MQLNKLTKQAQQVLITCQTLAQKHRHIAVEPEHLALALILTPELTAFVEKKKVDHKALVAALMDLLKELPQTRSLEPLDPHFSLRLIQALSFAESLAIKKSHEQIVIADLLLALIENRDKFGALGGILSKFLLPEQEKKIISHYSDDDKSILFSFTENINHLIKNNQLDPVFARDKEIEQLIQILSRKTRNNPILIGEAGIGRTSIVYGLAKRIIDQKVPSHLIGKEILSLDMGALISGTTLRGQLEERIKNIVKELVMRQGHYIILLSDMGMIMGGNGDGTSDLASLLKPSLSRMSIQIIGLATPEIYKKRIEKDASLLRFWQSLWINQPSLKECKTILMGLKDKYEQFHGVFIEDDTIDAAIELGSKHLSGQVLPLLALDVIDEACSRHRLTMDNEPLVITEIKNNIASINKDKKAEAKLKKLNHLLAKTTDNYEKQLSLIASIRSIKTELNQWQGEERNKWQHLLDIRMKEWLAIKKDRLVDPFVKRDDIASVISLKTGIPADKMMTNEREKLAHMEELLGKYVIGQKEAITSVSNAIRRARVNLKDEKKPIGSFLFLGPTGVGKTETARALTNFLFDDEKAMIRFDMSEFMERHSVARLIGAPLGYQGAEEGGELTEKVKRKPYAVVLFDEIEKAHSDVLNVLLQVLDDGRLTDAKGNLVLFNNTVIIMTSNLGAEVLIEHHDLPKEKLHSMVIAKLNQFLRPELINRIDEIMVFDPISKTSIRGILDLMLNQVIKRMSHFGFTLHITEEVKEKLINEGYNREFGARPLKRAIQRLLENPLAMALVLNKLTPGKLKAYISENNIIEFSKIT